MMDEGGLEKERRYGGSRVSGQEYWVEIDGMLPQENLVIGFNECFESCEKDFVVA